MNLPVATHDRTQTDRPARVNEESPPEALVAWSLKQFESKHLAMTTSFGMEGCALIDMYGRHERPLTVVYLDTMFFFQETYELRDRMIERYPKLAFVNRGTTLTPEEQEALYGPELWKNNPDLCCKLRKVDPMTDALRGVDVWITGLRRGQSQTRANIRVMDWDWKYNVIKFSPLANMSRQQIWEYIEENNVPYNKLHEQGYPTIGCTHCTAPVPGSKLGEYSRAGRWAGKSKTECGLHGDGI